MTANRTHADPTDGPNQRSEDVDPTLVPATADPGDLALIEAMLSLTPQQRLSHLEETLRSLEALLAATGTTIPAE